MQRDCPFLESIPRWSGDSPFRCAIGVNFYSVGPERELCGTCSIAEWGQALLCPHLDTYTFRQVNGHGRPSVSVRMECCQPRVALSDQERCPICPEMRDAGPNGVPGPVSPEER
jgi:hypothetical protein